MQNQVPLQAEIYAKKHKRRKIWRKIVASLACLVVFVTTYMLILPAVTMEQAAYCGLQEHQHSDACYELRLVCGYGDAEETAAEEEQPQQGLICELEESAGHVHEAGCIQQTHTLVCPEAHEHTEQCYETADAYICGLTEGEGAHTHSAACYAPEQTENRAHVHSEACYEKALICEQTEHAHTLACYSNPEEDVESSAAWERSVADAELTGIWAEDVLRIAESQLGYQESTHNYIITEDGELKGITRYGQWYGDAYGDWCAMFASFCLRYAEVPNFPYCNNCRAWIEILSQEAYGLYEEAGAYEAAPGDLIFFDLNADGIADHVGLVAENKEEGEGIRTIEGNRQNRVQYMEYAAEDSRILGFGRLPEKESGYLCGQPAHTHNRHCYGLNRSLLCPLEEHTHAEACLAARQDADGTTLALANDFFYENDRFALSLHVEGSAQLQEQATGEAAEETAGAEVPVLVVSELDAREEEYQQAASALEEDYADNLLDLSVLSMQFYYRDTLLDVSSCDITAQVTPQPQMLETAQAACAELESEAVPEAEAGVVFAMLQATEEGTQELDSTVVDASTEESPVLTASVDSSSRMMVAAAKTANPNFTVQYYAWLDMAADSGSETDNIPVIDTHTAGGAVLPQNGTQPVVKNLYLEAAADGSGRYGIKTNSTLTQVYSSHTYEYITAPNLTYFNRLYENGHYAIKEVWILKDGKDAASTNPDDWNIYPSTTHFTNRVQSVNDTTVLITEGTVIRLVFDTTASVYTNAVNFYDYDLTDDGENTAAHGINSDQNYSGSGVHLAFGNDNTDTGLSKLEWNGNTLNMANANGYSKCTFGLAVGLSNGVIQYADGIAVPKLFDDGNANGKTSYDSGQYTLAFDRDGDTYTLASVGGTSSANHLQTFTSRWNWDNSRKIWSNHFWPMDNVKGKDPHTGATGNTGTYIGAFDKTGIYPTSDNGIAHNNMFGMTYQVQFTLTEDYIGPLEYYFFGDDDMWVFLDGTLVCDIGGVHSSVGEYVNLWDYVAKGSAGTHTLTFYYTERGLSGSTCYMQFTLPSVSSITPEQNTGLLTVQKLVEGAVDSEEEFHFEIMFTDADGRPLPDDYSYTRYTAEGAIVKQDVIIYDGGSFELKAGEYIIVNYLPYGTKYTVTETDVPYYTVSYQVNGGASADGYTAAGQIPNGGNGSVVFTNTAMPVLPATGGPGILLYMMGGILLTTAAILLLYKNKRRKEDTAPS